MEFRDTGINWVLPSPNMPTMESTYVYPGMCLLEGTNISEGRGTTHPFTIFGAPFIDSEKLKNELGDISGIKLRELSFKPKFQKFENQLCNGLEIHIFDKSCLNSWELGLYIVNTIKTLWPDHFKWRINAYEFVQDIPAFDLLCGTDKIRNTMENKTFSLKQTESVNPLHWNEITDNFKIYKTND